MIPTSKVSDDLADVKQLQSIVELLENKPHLREPFYQTLGVIEIEKIVGSNFQRIKFYLSQMPEGATAKMIADATLIPETSVRHLINTTYKEKFTFSKKNTLKYWRLV